MSTDAFSHLDAEGNARMVDVGSKPVERRVAVAGARLVAAPATLELLRAKALPKGDVLATARLAGIMAAKRTPDLIPLCHSLPLDAIAVEFEATESTVEITATVATSARTGVEMEALTAATVAALTLYDMMKAVDKAMRIENVTVVSKTKSAL